MEEFHLAINAHAIFRKRVTTAVAYEESFLEGGARARKVGKSSLIMHRRGDLMTRCDQHAVALRQPKTGQLTRPAPAPFFAFMPALRNTLLRMSGRHRQGPCNRSLTDGTPRCLPAVPSPRVPSRPEARCRLPPHRSFLLDLEL